MSADASWAQATNKRAGIPYERDVIAELDAENARLHGELIDVQCELATARAELRGLGVLLNASRHWLAARPFAATSWSEGTRALAAAVEKLEP